MYRVYMSHAARDPLTPLTRFSPAPFPTNLIHGRLRAALLFVVIVASR